MSKTNNFNHSSLTDHLKDDFLISYLDGELSETDKNFAGKHLEECWECRGKLKDIQDSIDNFMELKREILVNIIPPSVGPEIKLFDERFQNLKNFESSFLKASGREYHLESEFTPVVPARHGRSFGNSKSSLRERVSRLAKRATSFFNRLRLKIVGFASPRWRLVTVPATLILLLAGLIFWFAISPSTNISAGEILSESERRTGLWQKQPGKVLQWCWETTLINNSQLPDGKYRSIHWLNNTGRGSFRLIRKYDQNGVLVWATWTRADGSDIVYSNFPKKEIAIYPTIDALRAYAAGLDEKKKQTVERYIELLIMFQQLESEVTNKQQALRLASHKASVQIIQTPDVGKEFRVNLVSGPRAGEKFSRKEMEYDIAADSFIKHRLKSVRYYPDGKIEVEDAKLEFYRETSIEDFNVNDLTKEMEQVTNILQVTPEEFLKHVTPETVLEMEKRLEIK